MKFDIIVIGAGSAGLTASIGLAKANKKVLLIEREKIGGDCTNTGCVPSKALIHQASLAKSASKNDITTLANNALQKVRNTIDSFLVEETSEKIAEHGVHTVVMGNAQFIDSHTVTVNNIEYTAKNIIISTGSSPRELTALGIEHANAHTSDTIFTLNKIPKNLLVIGSGPIGMELGQAFHDLGSNVTIASIDSGLGRLEEPEVAKEIQEQFKNSGITFIGNAYLKGFDIKGTATFDIKDGDKIVDTVTIKNDTVLISIGRVPNIDMNLEAAGIAYSKYGITVNKKYKTSEKHVFAIGDVSDRFKFTHVADDAARNVIKQILIPLPVFAKKRVIPKVTL